MERFFECERLQQQGIDLDLASARDSVFDTETNFYQLSERFFNIWYLMRLAPRYSKRKVIWLVRFLDSWYEKETLAQRAKQQIN